MSFIILLRGATSGGAGAMTVLMFGSLPVMLLTMVYIIWRTSWLTSDSASAYKFKPSQLLAMATWQLLWRVPISMAVRRESEMRLSTLLAVQFVEYLFAPLMVSCMLQCESPRLRGTYALKAAPIGASALALGVTLEDQDPTGSPDYWLGIIM